MGYTSKYAQDQMNKTVSTKQDKPKEKKGKTKKKHVVTKGETGITRKEAKDAKAKRPQGHAIKKMSVRKIKKTGGKASF